MPELLVQIGVLGAPALLAFLLGVVATRGRGPLLALLLGLAVLVATALLGLFWTRSNDCMLRIQAPVDGASVPRPWTSLEGVVRPPEARVFVLVHPANSNRWWVQPSTLKGTQGAWRCEINLGDAEAGRGEYFQIVAVASTNPWFIDALRRQLLREGSALIRPPALPSSPVVTLWRTPE